MKEIAVGTALACFVTYAISPDYMWMQSRSVITCNASSLRPRAMQLGFLPVSLLYMQWVTASLRVSMSIRVCAISLIQCDNNRGSSTNAPCRKPLLNPNCYVVLNKMVLGIVQQRNAF